MRRSRNYWARIATDDIVARIQNRAKRLARLFEVDVTPAIIANEKLILDEAYAEWAKRMDEAGTPATPTLN